MRVQLKSWDGVREMALESALTPNSVRAYESGALERTQSRCDELERVVGRLLALLVTERTLTLEQAAEIAGIPGDITILED